MIQAHPKRAAPPPPIRTGLLLACNQAGCLGSVDREVATPVLHQLHRDCPDTIQFDEASLVDRVAGGTCSAMTLEYIERVMKWLAGRPISSPSGEEWVDHLTTTTLNCDSRSMTNYRSEQAALNCIRGAHGVSIPKIGDPAIQSFHQEKVEALVRWKGLTIASASSVFDHRTDREVTLDELIGELEDGVYFVRCITPLENDKRERYRHSMVFIRTPYGDFFFDPNLGTDSLGQEDQAPALYRDLHRTYDDWGNPRICFYRLGQRKSS